MAMLQPFGAVPNRPPFGPIPRRSRTPDPSPPSAIAELALGPPSSPKRPTLVMTRHGSDDNHERRRDSKLPFSLGASKQPRGRPEHGDFAETDEEPSELGLMGTVPLADENKAPASGKMRPKDGRHQKFASEGWADDDSLSSGGSAKLSRRMSTLRGVGSSGNKNTTSGWRNVKKQVSAAARAAAHSLAGADTYQAGGGRRPSAVPRLPPSYGLVGSTTVDVAFLAGGGPRHQSLVKAAPAKDGKSVYAASIKGAPSPRPQSEAVPPLPTGRPQFARSASCGEGDGSLRATYQSQSHHALGLSSGPSGAPTSSTCDTVSESDAGSESTGHTTSVQFHKPLRTRSDSTTSIHHYQMSETSLTSSPASVISPLSPVTPRTPYGPGVSPGIRQMSRTFRQPNIDEVLPFASSPFTAWDPLAIDAEASNAKPKDGQSPKSKAKWRDVRAKGAAGSRRIWHDAKGKEVSAIYKVGWERDVLDLEERLHEAMYEIAGGKHSFSDAEPSTVLDLGTGTGAWPVSAALQWRNTRIIGADLVPAHIDLHALAAAEARARSTASGTAESEGLWASVAARVEFKQFNFLDGLPYDSGVFDMVHIRFVGLGVPETKYAEVLDEAVRVLRPGGVLEIVEMSCEPPPSAPPSVANSFASQLLSDFIPQNPILALQMHLPATAALVRGSAKPIFQTSWAVVPEQRDESGLAQEEGSYFLHTSAQRGAPPSAIADAAPTWIRSALSYRGTGLRALKDSGTGAKAARELAALDPTRWGARPPAEEDQTTPRTPAPGGRITLAAWVAVKA